MIDLIGFTWSLPDGTVLEVVESRVVLAPGYVDVQVRRPDGTQSSTCRVASQVRAVKLATA